MQGKRAIDAVEAGVMVVENDPNIRTVGLGGYPDMDGKVTLDACIMDEHQRCGSVAFLVMIQNPIAVARQVMEKTPHVMLVGEGALQFAMLNGFKKRNLLTPETLKEWEKLYHPNEFKSIINIENHDTIGMVARDTFGNLGGACTTSGVANKLHGRVGDSPIIGAGLYVDNEVGGAASTGLGEAVIRHAGSAMVVELMRQGRTPEEACHEIVERIAKTHGDVKDLQVGFIAMRKDGEIGGYALRKGFNYALYKNGENKMYDSSYKF